ncbi:SirB1 family protein [Vibrio sp.]|nr:SirB1 family protein [Vibrio sp.]
MKKLIEYNFDEMSLVEGALQLNQCIEPNTEIVWAQQELQRLVERVKERLSSEQLVLANEPSSNEIGLNELSEEKKLSELLTLFYQEWQFKGDHHAFFDIERTQIDKVLRLKIGIPASLGAIFLFLGRAIGLPLNAVTFPTQFLIKVDWAHKPTQFINPFNGEFVMKGTLHSWLIGHFGYTCKLENKHMNTASHSIIIERWLNMIKGVYLRDEHYTQALLCSDLALELNPDDPYERRDRGFIYQQLECHQVAQDDYEFFIDQRPDDPTTKVLKEQLNKSVIEPVTVH